MAIQKPTQLDLATARQLLLATKDLAGATLEWLPVTMGAGEAIGGARMRIDLDVLGHRVRILATENGFGSHQIMLHHDSSAGNLARLCDVARHQNELHWHHFEDMPGLSEERHAVTPATIGGAETTGASLFVDVFGPAMNIDPTSYTIQGGML